MKLSWLLPLTLLVLLCGFDPGLSALGSASGGALAQTSETDASVTADTPEEAQESIEVLTYDDYTVKGYSLGFLAGSFSGSVYLDNKPLGPKTVLTPGAGDIIAYDGSILRESQDPDHYTGAQKEIKPGPALGGRIGIFISDNFHLDLSASYSKGESVTSMLYTPDPNTDPDNQYRVELDTDDGFQVYKGGVGLSYDAVPATIFGLVPQLGFGLGGIINHYSQLEDVTALYLEGVFGLNYEFVDNFNLGAQVNLTTFAFEVTELGYSNMVNYTTFSLGLTWFIDVLPSDVRAAHDAEKTSRSRSSR